MLVRAWDKVSVSTIQNCFRAAGISQQSQECTLTDADIPLAEEIDYLRERAPELAQENVTAEIVVEWDDAATTFDAAPLTDEDIVAQVRQTTFSDNGEEGEEMDKEPASKS